MNGSVSQTLVFEYMDETGYYWGIKEPLLSREKDLLKANMQLFLDEEEVYINDERVFPKVKDVLIYSISPTSVRIIFLIRFAGKLRKGKNVYANFYDEAIAEYPFYAVWYFPENSRVIDAQLGVKYFLDKEKNILYFFVEKGTKIKGKESIVFLL